MRISVSDHRKPCGCGVGVGCSCNDHAELDALEELVDRFANAMKRKLVAAAVQKGKSGWDDREWTPEEIRLAMFDHVAKGDPIDVANFAAFYWNRQA